MSSGFNQAIVMGRLIAPAESIPTKSGSIMLKATLEVSTFRRGADGTNEEQITKLPVTIFGKLATTFAQYVDIGHLVQVVGRLDGYERPGKSGAGSWLTLSFIAEQLILLPNGKRDSANPAATGRPTEQRQTPAQKEFGQGFKPPTRSVTHNEFGEPSEIDF
jgi:single-stranded DNA-binding protein